MKSIRREFYQEKEQAWQKKLQTTRNQINRIAALRLLAFLIGFGGLIFLWRAEFYNQSFIPLILFTLIYLWLIKRHQFWKTEKKLADQLILINKREAQSLDFQYGEFRDGEAFYEAEHPYLLDLDLFGPGSLYQYMNRAATYIGEKRLADNFKYPSTSAEEIRTQQAAIQELKGEVDWRQTFQASGLPIQETQHEYEEILQWMKEPPRLYPRFQGVLWLGPAMSVILLMAVILNLIPWQVILYFGILQLAFVATFLIPLQVHSLRISKLGPLLRKYQRLLFLIENRSFQSQPLQELQNKLRTGEKAAHEKIQTLINAIDSAELGGSMFGLIFNGLFLWSLQFLYRVEVWQKAYGQELSHYLKGIAEFDNWNSLANFAANNSHYPFPNIQEEGFALQSNSLGHPLIPGDRRVNNPVRFNHFGQINIITGANMAGKSTYLRSIAINLILAKMGAPVCAEDFTFTPLPLYSSMRNQDSLGDNESFFYAELKKLKRIIEHLKEEEKIFIILDEILKGTNSADQHKGSEALIEQLIRLGGIGLIATHDLKLGELAKKYPDSVINYCFEIEIQNDELQFDYKLRPGINSHLNATFLMKKMGITV